MYYAIYGTTKQIFGEDFTFLGIDSLFSDWQQLLSEVTIDNRVFKITMPNGEIREVIMPGQGGVVGDYASKLYLGKYLDIVPKAFGATATTGYCARIWHSNVNGAFCKVKSETDKPNFRLNSTIVGAGYDSNSVGANFRLTYTGKITETKDVEYFKSVPIIN